MCLYRQWPGAGTGLREKNSSANLIIHTQTVTEQLRTVFTQYSRHTHYLNTGGLTITAALGISVITLVILYIQLFCVSTRLEYFSEQHHRDIVTCCGDHILIFNTFFGGNLTIWIRTVVSEKEKIIGWVQLFMFPAAAKCTKIFRLFAKKKYCNLVNGLCSENCLHVLSVSIGTMWLYLFYVYKLLNSKNAGKYFSQFCLNKLLIV